MRSFYSKLFLISMVVLVSVLCLLPTINSSIWPYKKINLGLDLQGGMHVLLAIDTDKAITNTLEQACTRIRSFVKKNQIPCLKIENSGSCHLKITLKDTSSVKKFKSLFHDEFSEFKPLEYKLTKKGFFEGFAELSNNEIIRIQKFTLEQALKTIRNRIDQFGVNEPDIRLHGTKHILVQLPGVKDTKRAKELIGRTAMLEFKIIGDTSSFGKKNEHKQNKTVGKSSEIERLLRKPAVITGAHLADAKVCIDSRNTPYVTIKFDKVGSKIFERVTSENINKRMAIILDNKFHSAPVITEMISGGQARITGRFTLEDAKDLAIILRAGALPAPVKIIEERTVGPSLGKDSIKTGCLSMCIGTLIVAIFMIIYYKIAGLIANLALILNVMIITASLAFFQATLTLPGIAGIILTIGMAVDANVLIFERIREETRLGHSPVGAIITGYKRATLTILDANITTLIAALVLFQFGTGPVKGFAVTLSLGVMASLFTSLVVTRTFFDYLFLIRKRKNLTF